MITIKKLLIICIIFIMTTSIIVYANSSTERNEADKTRSEVILAESIDLYDLNSFIGNSNIKIQGFVHEKNIEGRNYTGCYLAPSNMDFNEICNDFNQQYYAGLSDSIYNLTDRITNIEDEKTKESAKILLSDLKVRKNEFEKRSKLNVKKIYVSAEESDLENLYKNNKSKIKNIYIKKDDKLVKELTK